MLYVVWVSFHRWCHAPVVIIVSRFAHTGSLISGLWTGSLFCDGVKKSRGEGRKRVLSFSSRFFHPFPQTKSLFRGYLISYGLTALVEVYSTDNEVACVAGVERERGNLGAREIVWGARGRKKGKVPLLPPLSRVILRHNSLPLPFRTPATQANDEETSCVIERWNRTTKEKMWKYFFSKFLAEIHWRIGWYGLRL